MAKSKKIKQKPTDRILNDISNLENGTLYEIVSSKGNKFFVLRCKDGFNFYAGQTVNMEWLEFKRPNSALINKLQAQQKVIKWLEEN